MKKILLIEDEKDLRESTSDFLKAEGFKVIMAEDGVDGIQKALKNIPDVILCDITIPRIDGYEVLDTLKQVPSTSIIPFMFFTGKADRDSIIKGLQHGADDYIIKPFNFDELLISIRKRIQNQDKIMKIAESGFFTLLNNSLISAYICQGNRIVVANAEFFSTTGYNKEEVINKNFAHFLPSEFQDKLLENMKHCINGIKAGFKLETEFIKKDSTQIRVVITGNSFTYKGYAAIVGNIVNSKDFQNDNFHYSYKGQEVDKHSLTKRETEVMKLICLGCSTREIANQLNLSERTVEGHKTNLYTKCKLKNTASLVIYAIKNGYFSI
jgi:PAS domain S-box-containing protein